MKLHTLLICVITLGSWAVSATAEQLTVDYSFDRPKLSKVSLGGQIYDRVTMPGCTNGGKAGQPALPASGARLLLPMGAEVSRIEIVPGEQVALGEGYLIEPLARPVPLSAGPGAASPPVPDSAIYASDQPFPGTRFEKIGVHHFRGYVTLTLKLQPVQYVPTSGELYYYPRLTVVVDTIDTGRLSPLFRGFHEDEVEVRARVDNPAVADTYPRAGERDRTAFELLILTTESLAGAFVPLKNHHDSYGMPTEIHTTTTDVGSSDPVDVRDYIIERYLNDGIEYVIIGADDDAIPAKDLYVDGTNDMPGDLFFGCLDGTWNYDGDSYWGEPTDGEGGGDVDLVAEVFVGRAAADNTTEVGRFVDKTIWYVTGQHSQPEKVILVGEYLGFGGVAEYGGNYLDELIDGSDAHGYTTIGFPSDDFTIDTLYDRDWPGNDWPPTEIEARINAGQHIVNHLGHGSPDYAMKLYNSDVLNDLINEDLCFVYSQTCSAGHFDGTECWAETANVKTDHAAFGVVMNARYGYGEWYSTDGPSQRFNREFWDAVFNPDEDMPELGRANQDSKEDNLYRINEDCMRWCYYELNLFGDPAIAFKGTCTDAGTVTLDRMKYACEGTATILVNDCGLNTDDTVVDDVTVDIDSDSETGVEQVTLTETDPDSARFEGAIALSGTDSAGVLLVAEGDTVTVTYIDADDGEGGTDVVVTGTGVVDCTAPIISNVQAINIEARSATITFDTDEPTRGTVHYGTSCDSLTETTTGSGYSTTPLVELTGLDDNTTYFYAVEAEDEAGNTASDDNGGNCYTFITPEVPDFFTEEFDGSNDLDYLTLTFELSGTYDYYDGCTETIDSLPTDPAGGTMLSISEDSYQQVTLSDGQTVSLYGVSYSSFYVCDNGYITFTGSDSDYTESLADHFDMPRISPLFDDFSVDDAGGYVSWKQLSDRAVVTYENVPEYGTSNSSTFQVELFFDGTITISYLEVAVNDGLAGLSEGEGLSPDFYATDLSEMGACGPKPPTAMPVAVTGPVGVDSIAITLEATDDGLPDPPAALTYIVISLPAHGDLYEPGFGQITSVPHELADNGYELSYQPEPTYHGGDNFQYVANDGGVPPEGGDSDPATVSITMGGPDWDPQALDVTASTPVSIPVDVVLNAIDPNGDPLTYFIESLPASGSLSDPGAGAITEVPYELVGGGNVVQYAPPVGESLTAQFTYSAADATAGSNIATATVTVGGPEWDPQAFNVSASTPASTSVDVVLNATDPNGDPLTYFIESLPASGTLNDPGAGAITEVPYELVGGGHIVQYAPPVGEETLTAQFTYSAADATAGSNIATATVTVGGPAWAPVAYPVTAATPLSTPVDITLNAIDPNGDPLTYFIESLPLEGTLDDPGAGAITEVPYELVEGGAVVRYTPPIYQNLVAEFEYSARDATAGSSLALVTVTVGGPMTFFEDDFETDKGWTIENIEVESGAWERVIPIAGIQGAPSSDYDGSGRCYLTERVSGADVDGGPTRLISPTVNVAGVIDPKLRYARWFTCDDGDIDRLDVEISNDNGASWVLIESVPDTVGWVEQTIEMVDYITPGAQMKVRFSATDNPNNSITEAAIDAIEIWGLPEVELPCDYDENGVVDLADFAYFPGCVTGPDAGPPTTECEVFDSDADADVDLGDFAAFQAMMGLFQ